MKMNGDLMKKQERMTMIANRKKYEDTGLRSTRQDILWSIKDILAGNGEQPAEANYLSKRT